MTLHDTRVPTYILRQFSISVCANWATWLCMDSHYLQAGCPRRRRQLAPEWRGGAHPPPVEAVFWPLRIARNNAGTERADASGVSFLLAA